MFKSYKTKENHKVFAEPPPHEQNDGIHGSSDISTAQNVKFNLTVDAIHEDSSEESDNEEADRYYKKRATAALRKFQKNPIHKMLERLNKTLFKANDRAKEVTQQLIRLQTKEYERKDSLFNYVVQDDLAGLINHLERAEKKHDDFNADKKEIEKNIDPTGANIIHAAYLFKKYKIGRWLVQNYPEQAFLPFSDKYNAKKYGDMAITEEDMPYTGENILHMLIVHKDLVEIRWLLEFYDNHKHSVPYGLEILLKTSVKGTFFEDDGDFYCGSYPLHFAAGANSPELFDLILAYFTSVSTNNQGEISKETRRCSSSTAAPGNQKSITHSARSDESSTNTSIDDSNASAPLINPKTNLKSVSHLLTSPAPLYTLEEEKASSDIPIDESTRHGNKALNLAHQSLDKLASNYHETHEKLNRIIHRVPRNRNTSHHDPDEDYVSKAEKYRRAFLAKHRTDNLGANAIFMRDRYGNNCLHLCVIHRLTGMYDHIKKVAASILRQEIKTAYGHFLNKLVKDPNLKTIQLKPLPSWDVVHDFNERIKRAELALSTNVPGKIEKLKSRIPTQLDVFSPSIDAPNRRGLMSVKNKSYADPSSDGVQHQAYHDYNDDDVNTTQENEECHASFKIRNPVWKAYKKNFDNVVERYFPLYSAFSPSRLKREKLDKIVRENKLDNGFYYGYSLRESLIYPPEGDMTNNPASQSSIHLWLEEMVQKKIEERFEWVLNERFHSPLTLTSAGMSDDDDKGTDAQEERERDTIKFIINKSKQFRWKYGPVTSNLLYLEGVEVPYDCRRFGMDKRHNSSKPLPPYADAEMFGVVEWICITNSDKSAKIAEVEEIIEEKWRKIGSRVFIYYFLTWSILCVCITFLVCYGYVSPNPRPNSIIQMAVTVIYPLTLFIIGSMTFIELPSIFFYGFEYWGFIGKRIRGAAKLNKILQTITIVLFAMICVYKVFEYEDNFNAYNPPDASVTLSNSTSTDDAIATDIYFIKRKQCEVILIIVVWLNMFYYMMGFEQTGPFVLTVANIVGRDVPYFCTFYVIILIAYSAALNALCMNGSGAMYSDEDQFGLHLLFAGIFDLIQVTVNMGLPSDSIYSVSNVPVNLIDLYNIVLTTFYIIVGLMFINLLIGMIGNTYNIYQEYSGALLIMEKYNIMCGLEMSICWFVNAEDRVTKYAIKVEHEAPSEPTDKGDFRKSRGKHGTSGKPGKSPKVAIEDTQFPLYAFEIVKNDELWWLESEMKNDKVDSNMTQTLLILDPQNDFYEGFGQPGDAGFTAKGSIPVPGSNDDSLRIHDFIINNMDKIDNIIVTMDSHYSTHIAHKCFWKKGPNYGKTLLEEGVTKQSKRRLQIPNTPKTPTHRVSSLSNATSLRWQSQDALTPHRNKAMSSTMTESKVDASLSLIAESKCFPNSLTNANTNSIKLQPLGPIDKTKTKEMKVPSSTESKSTQLLVVPAEEKGLPRTRSKQDAKLCLNPQDAVSSRYGPKAASKGPSVAESIHPSDYTVISHNDVIDLIWVPVNDEMYEWCVNYTKELEKQGKLKLTIWPNHCIIGTPGHAVVPPINDAIQKWAIERERSIQYIMKGQNLRTEMYSALSADVEDPADPSTAFNERFMSKLRISDQIYVCGQAKSHVVKFTLLDILKYWHSSASKIYLLEDGCSSLKGHEKTGDAFVDDMRKQGVTVIKCDEAFPEKLSTQQEVENREQEGTLPSE